MVVPSDLSIWVLQHQSLDLGSFFCSCCAPNSSHSFSLSSERADQPYHYSSCNPFYTPCILKPFSCGLCTLQQVRCKGWPLSGPVHLNWTVKTVFFESASEFLTLSSLTVKQSLSRLDIQKVVHFEGTLCLCTIPRYG